MRKVLGQHQRYCALSEMVAVTAECILSTSQLQTNAVLRLRAALMSEYLRMWIAWQSKIPLILIPLVVLSVKKHQANHGEES